MKLALAALAALAVTAVAAAKDFQPGDLRLCNGDACVAIESRAALNALSRFYYGRPAPRRVVAPRNGARMYELRFTNNYVTGFAAGVGLDRFLSGGVNLGQFAATRWYHIPPVAAAELRQLAHTLPPLHVTPTLVNRSH